MINKKILQIASNTKNVGLKNKFTHRTTLKNSICGDFLKVEFILTKNIVKSMRYETESCILCEASASLLSKKVRSKNVFLLKKEINHLKKKVSENSSSLPKNFKEFSYLISKNNMNRANCVILPLEAFLKVFKNIR